MKGEEMKGCGRYKQERLLLFAFGELDDRDMEEHVKACPGCRDFLAGVADVRKAAKIAGLVQPGELVMQRLRAEAADKLRAEAADKLKVKESSSPAGGSSLKRLLTGTGPAFRWALAGIAVLLVLSIYLVAGHRFFPDEGSKRVPAWVSGVSDELASLESSFDEIDETDTGEGPLDMIFPQQETISGIELSMLDLEQSLAVDYGVPDEDVLQYDSDYSDEPVEYELIPLLPGLETGRST